MNSKTKAILCILLSAFFFALMNAFVRLSGDIPSVQKSFFRNFVALIFAAVVIIQAKEPMRMQKKNLPVLLIRAAAGTVGVLCNFYAIDHMLLADASMLNKLSPFFTIIFSAIFLRERINTVQLLGLVAAFFGALLIIKPGLAMSAFPALIGVLSGVGAGAAYTAVRYLGQNGEQGAVIVLFFSVFSCAVTLPFLIWDFTPMAWWQLGFLLLAGLAAACGQFTITAAYSLAPAYEISVYDYTHILFSALLGIFLFGQLPDGFSMLGYVIICGVSVYLYVYNRRLHT